MAFDHVEKLKREYTDKFVVVDGERPELARFRDTVGQVKTVNMSGRALVEFNEYHLNIGWYDIDVDYLKVVDKPAGKPAAAAKPAAKQPAKQPAKSAAKPATSGEKLSPLELARMADTKSKEAAPSAKEKASPAGKQESSTADILAAARAGASAEPAAKESASPKPAAKPAPAAKPKSAAKADGGKPSTSDILAMARGETASPTAEASAPPPPAPEPEPEPVAAEPEPAAAPAQSASAAERLDKSSMSIDDMIEWCRTHDA